MALPELINLAEVLNLGHEKTIVDLETDKLTATGENYGSQMLALKVQIKNKTKMETLEAVAKIPPPGEFMRRMFNTPVTFRNEIDFYQTILPELERFLHEKIPEDEFNPFPKFLGARFSLDPNKNEVDDDALLILENLKVQGYEMVERTIGFDYETAKLLIKAIARYHSVPLGLKLFRPEVFEKIRKLFRPYQVFQFDSGMLDMIVENTRKLVGSIESVKEYADRAADALRASYRDAKNDESFVREPFATIVHTDAWVNNFMVLFDNNNIPIKCKMVDFQLNEYGSPVCDIIFFILTSIQSDVVRQNYDELIKFYHENFINDLESFGCDISPFSWDEFQKEVEIVVRESEFYHCMMMLHPMFANDDTIKELDEYSEEDMTQEKPISEKFKEKAEFIVQEFVKRNWI